MTEAEVKAETLRRVEEVQGALHGLADFLHKNRHADPSGLATEIFHRVLFAENGMTRILGTLRDRA